ncbi:MAG: hypothetical protein AAGG02_00520 [Cyanobacteria bacterium P01_H01_bin.15]
MHRTLKNAFVFIGSLGFAVFAGAASADDTIVLPGNHYEWEINTPSLTALGNFFDLNADGVTNIIGDGMQPPLRFRALNIFDVEGTPSSITWSYDPLQNVFSGIFLSEFPSENPVDSVLGDFLITDDFAQFTIRECQSDTGSAFNDSCLRILDAGTETGNGRVDFLRTTPESIPEPTLTFGTMLLVGMFIAGNKGKRANHKDV